MLSHKGTNTNEYDNDKMLSFMMSFTTCVLLILSYPVLSIFPRAMSKVFQLFSFCNRTKSKQIITFNSHSLMRQLRFQALLNFLHSQGFGSKTKTRRDIYVLPPYSILFAEKISICTQQARNWESGNVKPKKSANLKFILM